MGIASLTTVLIGDDSVPMSPRLCVVCVFSSHLFWTSSSLDVPACVFVGLRHITGLWQPSVHNDGAEASGLFGYRGLERYWNWNSGNNRVRCSPDWSVYRCIERYCMTPRQREDDNNLSVGHRNHLKLGIEPESWLQSHELGF